MFVARRTLLKNKLFTNFICTSNILNCDKPKDKTKAKDFKKVEKNAKISVSSEGKINKSEFITQKNLSEKPKHVKEKKLYLGITEESVKNVAKEFRGDIKKTTEEIFNYLNEMEISKDSLKNEFSIKDVHETILSSSVGSFKKNFLTSTFLDVNESKIAENKPQVKLKIWDDLEAEELRRLSKKSPTNCFEEMIAWTEEGKLWRFPIDNDQGMEREAEISFTEHIFLEQYLEPWCPKKGPLKKFMELVLIGLSKNHLYTVQEKKDHIDWFRKYFEEKKKLLQELGAMGSAKEPKEIGVSSAEEKA